jgi:uncharacterized protein (DUF1499 family)
MKNPRVITMLLALIALAMVVAAGPGTRLGWWPWDTGFAILTWGTYVGFVAFVAAAVLVLMLAVPRWRARPWVPVTAFIVAVLAIAPPLMMRNQAKSVPRIHDITTDTADPPAFVALLAERQKARNGADYRGAAIATQQQQAYPDIKPLIVKAPPAETVQKAIDAARSLGWEIVSSDAPAGRIEATATTSWWGFKDDVVIRVRPEGTGSRVDVRSMSRVGLSDLGANAKRVREFLAKLG